MRRSPSPPPAGPLAVSAPAKVNLHLEVLARRPDGFHSLETLMAAVSLADSLLLMDAPRGSFTLTCSDPALDCGPGNLVSRAAEALRRRAGEDFGATVHLTKRVPVQGGLAGGSSDAAATLAGLNRLWNVHLPPADLDALAAALGSDVTFFLHPPAAWCTGRGEVVTPTPLAGRLHLVLVVPPFGLSTPAVFRGLTVPTTPVSGDAVRAAAAAGDAPALANVLHNRLEEPAVALRPELADLLRTMRAAGPLAVRMSGSGSTLFALCRDARDAARAATTLRTAWAGTEPAPRVMVVRSLR